MFPQAKFYMLLDGADIPEKLIGEDGVLKFHENPENFIELMREQTVSLAEKHKAKSNIRRDLLSQGPEIFDQVSAALVDMKSKLGNKYDSSVSRKIGKHIDISLGYQIKRRTETEVIPVSSVREAKEQIKAAGADSRRFFKRLTKAEDDDAMYLDVTNMTQSFGGITRRKITNKARRSYIRASAEYPSILLSRKNVMNGSAYGKYYIAALLNDDTGLRAAENLNVDERVADIRVAVQGDDVLAVNYEEDDVEDAVFVEPVGNEHALVDERPPANEEGDPEALPEDTPLEYGENGETTNIAQLEEEYGKDLVPFEQDGEVFIGEVTEDGDFVYRLNADGALVLVEE